MQRKKIMLLFGGESSEHTVSVSSARNVFAALDDDKYEVILGYIETDGTWWLVDNINDQANTDKTSQLVVVPGSRTFTTINNAHVISPDVILPILHGANGEDGSVQGLAQLMHIPIVGCGVAASAVAMDKVLTKQLLEHAGIRTVPYTVHYAKSPMPSYHQLSAQLGPVLFVKPAKAGSSIGVHKVVNDEELSVALADAHSYGDKVLIETAIIARELEVGILGGGSDAKASGVGEIKPDGAFYSFESKYDSSSHSQVIIPADIPDETSEVIRELAKRAYAIIGGEGLARVDFFLSPENDLYINEINTLPGFTNISMYPKLWRHAGVAYSELIDTLIDFALAKEK